MLYEKALLETEPDALLAHVHLAGAAMRARLQESPEPDRTERSGLIDGLRNLAALEREHAALPKDGHVQPTRYVTLSSAEHRWLGMSDGVCQILGYSREELLGAPAEDFVAPELREDARRVFGILTRESQYEGESAVVRKDGTRILFKIKARVLPDGSIVGYWYPRK